MKRLLFLWPVACLTFVGCKKEEPPPSKPASPTSGNPLTAPVDYLGTLSKGQQSAIKTLGAVSLDQAIKIFTEQTGRYPTNLNELVTGSRIADGSEEASVSGIEPPANATPDGTSGGFGKRGVGGDGGGRRGGGRGNRQ